MSPLMKYPSAKITLYPDTKITDEFYLFWVFYAQREFTLASFTKSLLLHAKTIHSFFSLMHILLHEDSRV